MLAAVKHYPAAARRDTGGSVLLDGHPQALMLALPLEQRPATTRHCDHRLR
ncbi:hypothetical protein HU761_02185 [Pseudomonas sp. SWRI59]|uniref:hypothetical protein n=1 Tax=Pseudomonas TaxID=286 RepID=UPI001648C627|nr:MULTISPECIES: hypothetical protein [unclassified Pseudomonas]MBC3500217.1 hypothetical protein [Pseudomonas sp. SWRI59]MBC3505546.1 hypothetical protein [Pseudomonas sp. SWRI68]UVL05132.1 hypothetical protein LOY26_06180 [Pseudomonas sp. B21-047]